MKNSPLNNLLKFSGRSFQNGLWKSHNIKKTLWNHHLVQHQKKYLPRFCWLQTQTTPMTISAAMFQIHITCRCFFVGVNPTRNKTMGGAEKGRKFRARSQPKSADGHITPVFLSANYFPRDDIFRTVPSICWYRIYTPNQNNVACENVI